MRATRFMFLASAVMGTAVMSFTACGGPDPCLDDPTACESSAESSEIRGGPLPIPGDEPEQIACAPCGADGKCADAGGYLGNDGPKCLITSIINAKIAAGLVPAHDPPANTEAQEMRDCVAECLKNEKKGPDGKPCYSDPSAGPPRTSGGMWTNWECMDAEGRCEDAKCDGPFTAFPEI